jgi:hypothetical protein
VSTRVPSKSHSASGGITYRRYRHGGGDAAFAGWESSGNLISWENAPAPALVAKEYSLLAHVELEK